MFGEGMKERSQAMRLLAILFISACLLPAADFDLLITGGRIVDGTGAPARKGDVAVKEGRIAALGEVRGTADKVIDAAGQVVAPGFIDVHTHSEKIAENPAAENFLRMGVTTIITGNCGNSRTDVAAFFEEIGKAGMTLNVATLIGHGAVREQGMGGRFIRAPGAAQMETMKQIVDQAMKDGAVGMSTGLIYVPGSFAKTDEIIELARVVSKHGGVYASHIRHETVRIFEAVDEFLKIAREAGVRAELSHIKLTGPTAWGRAAEVLEKLDQARAGGLEITHDIYAYTASSTGLRQTIPDSALEGTKEDFLKRLAAPAEKARIVEGMKAILARGGRKDYSYAVVARFAADPSLNGLSIPEAARKVRGGDSLDDQVELLLDMEARGGGSGIYHGMNEKDLRVFLKHPQTLVASDGGPRRLGEDVPHPRSYGNNARILARYVREQKVLSLEEAVRRMTSLPARTFRLEGRGELKHGAWADIVVLDPGRVSDPSTFKDPHHYAEGFSQVLVNGVPVIEDGRLTQARPGGPLRHGS
ncbi:MAG: N-acyl-D-glutamate deacylase [Prosthecobacter sp.]|nr:N-acyl-D-glutamate deacylase [Prosthecobacter sp.]